MIVLAIVIVILIGFVFYLGMQERALKEFYKARKVEFRIPEISKGFVPQGISYEESADRFFVTGYYGNMCKASPLFIVDGESGSMLKRIGMAKKDGSPFRGHAGGVTVLEDKVYIAGSTDSCMYVWNTEDIMNAQDSALLPYGEQISLKTAEDDIRVSFTSRDTDGLLYAGEFYKAPLFKTNKKHHLETEAGIQGALLLGFEVEDGIAHPKKVYSIPDSVQGACFDEQYVYLSQSNGVGNSKILVFGRETGEGDTMTVLGTEVPLYVLTEQNAIREITIPCMSEEIDIRKDDLFIMREAASNRYLIGKFTGAQFVHSIKIKAE